MPKKNSNKPASAKLKRRKPVQCSAIVSPHIQGMWREWKLCVTKSIELFKTDRRRSDLWAQKAATYAWDVCVELTDVG